MATLQVLKENAVKAFNEANSGGKTLLSNLFGADVFKTKITDRIKTFQDALDELSLSQRYVDDYCKDLSEDETAYCKIKIIVEALNEGWKADCKDTNQNKYYPYFSVENGFSFNDVICVCRVAGVGSRLCFKSRELAEYAGKQFLLIYKAYQTV